MADEEALHRCVTKFMIDTCRHSTSEYANEIPFLSFLARVAIRNIPEDAELFVAGSSAEFCIKPMLSCIGDVDVMQATCICLAIPHGYTPPTELPCHYERTVYVYEIIDSHQPGYVYLNPSHILTKTDSGRYLAKEYSTENEAVFLARLNRPIPYKQSQEYWQKTTNQEIHNNHSVQSLMISPAEAHGPALTAEYTSTANELYKSTQRCLLLSSIDCVPSLHCPVWPLQASSWPTRHRDHGWPDETTINIVVSNGCNVVGAVHPRCKQDEWMSEYQWRLSFSRAEITLLNSWTPVQQIIYHMLRFVMKREVLPKSNDNNQNAPTPSNYHIKTLMMWECEQKPQSWWSAESSLVKLCSSLLHKLSVWFSDKSCQHFFINDCDLLDYFVDDISFLMIRNSLKTLADESVLLSWFVENYIRRCAECCPPEVAILFQDISSCDKLERAVQAAVDWKWSTLPKELYNEHNKSETMILSTVMSHRRDAAGIQFLMKELRYFDLRLRDFFVAWTSLRVAYTISIHSLTEDLLEILWTLFSPCNGAAGDMDNSEVESGGLLSIRKAIKLTSLRSVGSIALEMLYNEISKAYLQHSFVCGRASTHSVVHVFLAVLYYKSGRDQAAVDHCEQVLIESTHDLHSLQSIGAEYLPHIDDHVDNAFGLVMFYEHVTQEALTTSVNQREVSKRALSTVLLALYVSSQCTAEAKSNKKLTAYRQYLSKTQRLQLCDVLLLKEMEMQHDQCTEIQAANTRRDGANYGSSSSDTSLLVLSLELVPLEKLITFRQVMVRELHSEQFLIFNEFEALYSYKCGLFEECLDMCRNHVKLLIRASCSKTQRFVIALPQAVSLLDGELVSLFGIIGILHPVLVLLLVQFPDFEAISVLTVSLYLMVQCQKKLREDSIVGSLQLIRFVHDKIYPTDNNEYFVDRLILKLTYRSLKLYIDEVPQH